MVLVRQAGTGPGTAAPGRGQGGASLLGAYRQGYRIPTTTIRATTHFWGVATLGGWCMLGKFGGRGVYSKG